jgi:hypothetical protein
VSEAGFMIDNETFQKLIGHFVELKDKIDGVKTGLTAGQTELKNYMENNISAVNGNISALETNVKGDISALETNVNGDISALETKINAGHEELRLEISVFQ